MFAAALAFLGVAGAITAGWLIAYAPTPPSLTANAMDEFGGERPVDARHKDDDWDPSSAAATSEVSERQPRRQSTDKHAQFFAEELLDARIEYLEKLASDRSEEWDSDFLWRMIRTLEGGELAKAAMRTSILIAESNAGDSLERAVSMALGVPSVDVRRAALRFVAKHNCPENAAALLEYYDKYPEDRAIALTTISCISHADAQIHILNVAGTDETPKDLRIRAIALLAKAQSPAAMDLLTTLSASSDSDIGETAAQALKSYHR